ncbi:MAG: hypothetical protein AAFY36_15565, partial [Bacteroidota bacterium]
MRKLSFSIVISFFYTLVFAQHHDNVWLLSDLGINSAQIDFSDGFLSIESIDIDADFEKSAAFISDSSGNLVLYTDGCHIYNADHEI